MRVPFVLSPPERRKLQSLARSRKVRTEDSRRARIVLGLAAGHGVRKINRQLGVSVNTVRLWRDRFAQDRLGGLWSRHPGRQPTPGAEALDARIIDWTLHRPPPDGSTHWSSRKLAARLSTSQSRVARVWAKTGLQPHRLRRYMTSNDPDFEAKAAAIIGLDLKPPAHAAVFCVDEKTAIQALDRLDPVLPLSPGRAERHGFEYYRHGTVSLYAALNTANGEVLGKTAARHTSAEFVAFLQDLVLRQRPAQHLHLIVDNLSAHKTAKVQEFLATPPTVHLHYTPTYSSWLNQVELWFSKIQRDLIARGIFTSKSDLTRKIRRYIRLYNRQAKPFKWSYRNTTSRIN